jgi:TRAP-type C4-dicarboxylate transport system permease small subunit
MPEPGALTIFRGQNEEIPMPATDQAVVAFVISTFLIFGLFLAYASWQQAQIDRVERLKVKKK